MFKRVFIVIAVSTLLVGCWDERLYKNLSVVSLAGIDGHIGDLKGYYAYPTTPNDPTKYVVIEGSGTSARDVRNHADLKVEQTLDLSELSTLLINQDSATTPLYDYLDIYFRNPQSPITAKVALTDGSVKEFVDIGHQLPSDVGEYYQRFIESFERNSIFPKMTLQKVCLLILEKGKDLVLPYLNKDKKRGTPIAAGLALFKEQVFTGTVLDPKESLLLTLLMGEKGTNARISYMWEKEGKKLPVSLDVIRVKKKWKIEERGTTATVHFKYNLNVNIEEYPHDRLYKNIVRKDVEKFLTKKVQEDVEGVLKKLQDAQSDPLGVGLKVRAFHPKVWDKNWGEKFAQLTLKPEMKVTIERTGILQ